MVSTGKLWAAQMHPRMREVHCTTLPEAPAAVFFQAIYQVAKWLADP